MNVQWKLLNALKQAWYTIKFLCNNHLEEE